ncbi:probable protein phosphatase 2C 43 isoform X1 [Cannabis sativa]|uniref:protein-serine/threonine phosphatase n=1 Tax=Cannabis sativa TaxID=3483 RepID=A0A803QP07_CANSA|nr:probable protein phosphatase 2C 43 isoform X1 [Cannabis sativa]
MLSRLGNLASACWKPLRYARMKKDDGGDSEDSLLWYRDLDQHSFGEFSFAVVQANSVLEDYSQVEIGRDATFVGIYDGHGGPEAARYVRDNLFNDLIRIARERSTISEDVIRGAFNATEEGFISVVRRSFSLRPIIAAMGSCCLVGIIWNGKLLIANVGDSRAVLGSVGESNKVVAEQLTVDHNASSEDVRNELRSLHSDDASIVVKREGVWRIKGIIQVSRSIGDAYLKRREFSLNIPRFRLTEPLRRPVLTAEPSLYTRVLHNNDKFLIFASDGLWEHLSNQEAAAIVHNNPRAGIAKRLLKAALMEAARKVRITYDDVKQCKAGERRQIHDDISVVVMFLDHVTGQNGSVPELSFKGFNNNIVASNFDLEGIT